MEARLGEEAQRNIRSVEFAIQKVIFSINIGDRELRCFSSAYNLDSFVMKTRVISKFTIRTFQSLDGNVTI